jgi:hypothetical protein
VQDMLSQSKERAKIEGVRKLIAKKNIWTYKDNGENCITTIFMACILHLVLWEWLH